MRALGNGQFEITNSTTGEKRVVNEADLPKYGLSSPSTQQAPQQLPELLKGIIRGGGNIVGGMVGERAGAGVGSLMGSIFPPAEVLTIPAGAYGGSVLGGGAGSAGAEAIINAAEDYMNNRPINIADVNYGDRFKEGAMGQALGIPIAKGVGLLAHPIKPLTDIVSKKISDSPAVANILNILDNWVPLMKDKFAQDTLSTEGAKAVDKVNLNTQLAARSLIPHDSSQISNDLSMPQLNQLKQTIQQSVSKYYGKGFGDMPVSQRAEIVARKDLAHTLKGVLEDNVPGIATPNNIASALHNLDLITFLRHAPWNLPGGGILRLVGYGSEPIRQGIQKAIPAGGGYLNQLLPALFSQPQSQ